MKLKKYTLKKAKLKKLSLLNSKFFLYKLYLGLKKLSLYYLNFKYLKGFRNNFSIFELSSFKTNIKNSLKIIYKFHKLKKSIFFIDFNEIKNHTNYQLLIYKSGHFYFNSDITKLSSLLKFKALKTSKLNSLVSLKKKTLSFFKNSPDLVVFLCNKNNYKKQKEIENIKTPSILFFNDFNKINNLFYKIPGNFVSFKSKLFVYLLIKSVLTFSKKHVY